MKGNFLLGWVPSATRLRWSQISTIQIRALSQLKAVLGFSSNAWALLELWLYISANLTSHLTNCQSWVSQCMSEKNILCWKIYNLTVMTAMQFIKYHSIASHWNPFIGSSSNFLIFVEIIKWQNCLFIFSVYCIITRWCIINSVFILI